MVATINTNGYLLTQRRIEELNEAGLQLMQISVDNVLPDAVSSKSLKVLDGKLQLLAQHAQFKVNINAVLGVSEQRTSDVITVAERAGYYGFSRTIGVVHDASGKLKPLSKTQIAAYQAFGRLSRSLVHQWNYFSFQRNLLKGKPNNWKCRAGARYLYICEHGLVHWCLPQRGYPGIPVTEYTTEDIRREFRTRKECSPFCTISCVHQTSYFDEWRGRQTLPDPLARPVPSAARTAAPD
jgi:MoaA/NifB/PqqE/SkfB family radical SAM enzyme